MSKTCGLCHKTVRFIGSHVINEHVPYAAGQVAVLTALAQEKDARRARSA